MRRRAFLVMYAAWVFSLSLVIPAAPLYAQGSSPSNTWIGIGGGWQTRTEFSSKGQFLWCASSKFEPTGASLVFNIYHWGSFRLYVRSQGLQLGPKLQVSASVRVDNTEIPASMDANIASKNFLIVAPNDPLGAMHEISEGNKLVVRIGRTEHETDLVGSRNAIRHLLECVRRNGTHELKAFYIDRTGPPVLRAEEEQRRPKGWGTGFFVSKEGHILTNWHVVAGCTSLRAASVGGKSFELRLVAGDRRGDLALLQAGGKPDAIPSIRSDVRMGESVYVFGFPLTRLLSSTGNFTVGNVTAMEGPGDDTRLLQISAPIQPGNSGGPVLDEFGNVVGVVVSTIDAIGSAVTRGHIPQNVNFAIRAEAITAFLRTHEVNYSIGSKGGERIPPAEIAVRGKSVALHIECTG